MRIVTFNVQNLRLRRREGRVRFDGARDYDMPDDNTPEAVALDLADRRLTAAVLAGADADVICLQEVFNLATLDFFHDHLLRHAGAQSYARQKAAEWWRKRAPGCAVPLTVDQAIAEAARLARPSAISVRPSGRYVEVSGYRFDPCANSTPASAPSVTGNLVGLAGSTPTIGSPTRGAMPAASTSAARPARTSAMGGRA